MLKFEKSFDIFFFIRTNFFKAASILYDFLVDKSEQSLIAANYGLVLLLSCAEFVECIKTVDDDIFLL